MSKIHKILVPVDFSELSLPTIKYALTWAKSFNGTISVLYVNELKSLPFGSSSYPFGVVTYPELEKEINQWADREYRALLDLLSPSDADIMDLVIETGKSSDVIADFADEKGYDLIIMAAHSRGIVEKFFLGSTTERLIRIMKTPAIILREPATVPPFPPKHVVITTDFSNESLSVLEPIHKLLGKLVKDYTLFSVNARDSHPTHEITESEKAKIEKSLNPNGEATVSWLTDRNAHVVDGILSYVNGSHPSLIAMATHGRSGLNHMLLGSNTESVLRSVHTPVLVVRCR